MENPTRYTRFGSTPSLGIRGSVHDVVDEPHVVETAPPRGAAAGPPVRQRELDAGGDGDGEPLPLGRLDHGPAVAGAGARDAGLVEEVQVGEHDERRVPAGVSAG